MLTDARIILIEKWNDEWTTYIKKKDTYRILEILDIMFESKKKNNQKLEVTIPKEWLSQTIKKVLLEQSYEISDEIHGIYVVEFVGDKL